MSTTEHAEAAVRFADILLCAHHTMPRSPDDPVQRCACGRAIVMCEIHSAARDAGLLAPVTDPAPEHEPEPAATAAAGCDGLDLS